MNTYQKNATGPTPMSENDGGPAFPTVCDARHPYQMCTAGMSLRDWFAGMALHGFCSFAGAHDADKSYARICFEMADAMLKERSK